MKTMKNFTLLKLAMGSLLAICFNAGFANAQNVAGKFTLPFEAHWGQATLPAGDYSFMLERGPDAKVRVFYRGPGPNHGTVGPHVADRDPEPRRKYRDCAEPAWKRKGPALRPEQTSAKLRRR
jgi:hypothetical protein